MKKILVFLSLLVAVSACVPNRKYNELKAKREKCEQERLSLMENNRKLETDNNELSAEIDRLNKEIQLLSEDSAYIGKRFRQTQVKYDDINRLNNELLDKLNALRREGQTENRKLLDELRQTQLDLQKREDAVRELEQELYAKKRTLDELSAALKQREQRVNELESLIAEKDAAVRQLKDRIANALLGFKDKGLTVEQRNGKIYVSLEAKLLFASGSTKVDPEGKKALMDLAKVIKDEKEITILVEGHTDSDPYNGSGVIKDNWDLSVLRATSVTRILTEDGKMDQTMVSAAGRGEYVPVAPNDSAENKAKNRRIEIILTPNLDKLFEIINE